MDSTLDNGRYAVLDCIGHGGTADVFAVIDEKLGIERAVKIPRERPDDAETDRLRREAAILVRLDHPGVLRVFDTFEHEGRPCLVMERCTGSLEERITRSGPLEPEAALALGEQLRTALTAVHAAGVLHRDVKPANVLYTEQGQPRLADFGVALSQRDPGTLTRTGAVLGTVAFMAPAVRRGEPESEATDRYGLAATVAYAALGALPGDVDRASVQRRLPPSIAAWVRMVLDDPTDDEGRPVSSPGAPRRAPFLLGLGLLLSGVALGALLARSPTAPSTPDETATTALRPAAAVPQPCDMLQGRANWQSAPGLREVVASDFLDITGDGHLDAVYVSQQDEMLHILPGGPDASVDRRIDLKVGRAAVPPTLLDLDLDGRPELILPERDDARLRLMWLGDDLAVEREVLVDQAGPMEHAQAIDIDGDGIDDLVGPIDFGLHLVWRRVPGDGTLEPQRYLLNVRGMTVHGMLGRDLLVEEDAVYSWRRLRKDGGLDFIQTIPADSGLMDIGGEVLVFSRGEALWYRANGEACVPSGLVRYLRRGALPGLRLGDWNADGEVDVIAARTCRGCTSELMVGLGL